MSISRFFIEGLGPLGDGISFGGRRPVFIDRAVPGDRVEAVMLPTKVGVSRAKILKVVSPSEHRVTAECPHYDRCGNCTVQHLAPSFYRGWKTEVVREALGAQGLRPHEWKESVFLAPGSRRRATFSAIKTQGKVKLGYYRRRSQEIFALDTCLVIDPTFLPLVKALKDSLSSLLLPEVPVDIFLQSLESGVEMIFTLPKAQENLRAQEALVGLATCLGANRVGIRESSESPVKVLWEATPMTHHFGKLKVKVPPASFLQPTREGEKTLVDAVLSALPGQGPFADLFSGIGTFSGPMLSLGNVDAYEVSALAVKALNQAKHIGLRAFHRDLFKKPLSSDSLNTYAAVVLDPPRAGCEEQARLLARSRCKTVISVSCNPATFARDARILASGGYQFQSVQMVDQFPWSHHVELVGVFHKS